MSTDLTTISHALADPQRVRLLAACLDRERCVCQLVELIDLSNASISKHLAVLRNAGLLVSRKDGRWVHYRTPDEPSVIVHDALVFFRKHAMRSPQILADQQTLKQIDAIEPSELARMQREGCCTIPTQTITPTINGDQT
ncbi:MAG: winged helix-turn-helix transcriptional regulator [Phycisphaerales bacterium]|nr:winged helix-turn-helix transcriptional regulator [Phycisphaerales bacterium]